MPDDSSSSTTTREEIRKFRALLRGILKGRKPVDELLENALFKRRLTALCRFLMRNEWDAKVLYNDVCFKVWRAVRSFKPDFKQPYGKFFAWLSTITHRTFFDKIRGLKLEVVPLEDPEVASVGTVIDANLEERKSRLWELIGTLPDKQRVAVTLYIEYGYTTREVADILTRTGMRCTHASVANWVRDALKAAFPEAPMIKEATSQAPEAPDPPRKPNAMAGRRAKTQKPATVNNNRREDLDRVKVTRKAAKV